MGATFITAIEDAIKILDPATHTEPRTKGHAVPTQDVSSETKDEMLRRYVYEAEALPVLTFDLSRQYWGSPYDCDYVVVKFAAGTSFKALDVVVLSAQADLSFDGLKAAAAAEDEQLILATVRPGTLDDGTWITPVPVGSADEPVYLYHVFVAQAPAGAGALEPRIARHDIANTGRALAALDNPSTVGGVAQAPHPAIPPHRIPLAPIASVPSAPTASSAALPFERLFLTLSGISGLFSPTFAFVVLNYEPNPAAAPQDSDFIALAKNYPTSPTDCILSVPVAQFDQNHSAQTIELCIKWIGSLMVADLDQLEKFYIYYVRKSGSGWVILGNPTQFKQQKHWMTESLPDIGHKRLHEIVIPGAHDVGSYDIHANNPNAQTQNLTFPGQLALGVRYFDCRIENWVKSHPAQPFWFYHGVYSYAEITDLTSALEQFIQHDKSRDIVILDFCRFKDFDTDQDYDKLFSLFTQNSIFAGKIIAPDEAAGLTISELMARGKRLFILCENIAARFRFNLGTSINLDAEWPRADGIDTLKPILDLQVAARAGSTALWALQAIIEPPLINPVSPYADEVNSVLPSWMIDSIDPTWWDRVNVLFCDFTAGADLVHTARLCNHKRNSPGKGDIFRYAEPNWLTGGQFPPGPPIGKGGWTSFKSVFATSGGVVYSIDWYGNLHRSRDTDWQNGGVTPSFGAGLVASPAGPGPEDRWDRYKSVFATSDGVFYAIDTAGKLYRYRDPDWQSGTATFAYGARQEIGYSGWDDYIFAFASSDGIVYGVDAPGQLYRYQDAHWKQGNGLMPKPDAPIDSGWHYRFKSVFATGEGVIYAIDWAGDLIWFRDTGTGAPTGGMKIGRCWADYRMVFATSEGRIYGID